MNCPHCKSQEFKVHQRNGHALSIWIYFAHWNFVRQHTTTRVSPAMAANATDHLWTIEELLNAGVSS